MSPNFKVESNVTLPAPKRGNNCKYPWKQMKKGQSFFVPCSDPRKKKISLYGAGQRHFKVAVRTESGGVRVWRVS